MDTATADRLSQLTTAFYEQVAESFSATRQAPWEGWGRVLEETSLVQREDLRLLDLACGNLRFERYLAGLRTSPMHVTAVDTCEGLAPVSPIENASITYSHLDLTDSGNLACTLGKSTFDAAVCFGFMHHLPLHGQRVHLLRTLMDCVKPQGYVAVTFWQLSNSGRLLEKARSNTERAAQKLGITGLDSNDYLLGWQDRTDVVRYCHDFTEDEIDRLIAAAAPQAGETARFSADGATGNLNRYLILRT